MALREIKSSFHRKWCKQGEVANFYIKQTAVQARVLFPFLLKLYAIPVAFLCLIVGVSLRLNIPIENFMRDPGMVDFVNPLTGVASNFGGLYWIASTTICFFSYTILKGSLVSKEFLKFLLFSAIITGVLTIDDLFLLHDGILPLYFGISEKAYFVVYAVSLLSWMAVFRRTILKTEYLLLAISLLIFGSAIFVDIFQYNFESLLGQWRILLEDGLKLFGIVAWFGYFFRTCLLASTPLLRAHGR